jgi:hypothetical protein
MARRSPCCATCTAPSERASTVGQRRASARSMSAWTLHGAACAPAAAPACAARAASLAIRASLRVYEQSRPSAVAGASWLFRHRTAG